MTDAAGGDGDDGSDGSDGEAAVGDDYAFETTVQVRFRDLDAFGHVNNAVYATYCETARTTYLQRAVGVDLSTVGLVVAHLSVDFRAPIDDTEAVTVGLDVTSLGRTSFTIGYDLRVGDDLVATAETVQVAVDPETRSSRPVPDEWRRTLAAHADDA
jgi:acyl-CoA thioester hydrolase